MPKCWFCDEPADDPMSHDCAKAIEARRQLETAFTLEARLAILFSHKKGKRVPPDAES